MSRRTWSRSADDLGKIPPSPTTTASVSFQAKIAEYRNRSNSNASLSDVIHIRQPFPKLTPPSSSSPPKLPPAVTISPAESPHVHTRSHSFTPKLASKLANQQRQPIPPSPKRKASNDANSESPIRTTGFYIKSEPTPSPSNRAMLAPPEPKPAPEKRTSQIVFHSGLVNRFPDFPANTALAKGWKPFKLELKGSKLYFYKTPSDRTAAVKELFPTTMVPDEDDNAEVESEWDAAPRQRTGARDDSSVGRKKRAFWGRKTHPDLGLEDGKIEKGSFEALVHEAVFATTFEKERSEQWKDFASAVLLCLPSLVTPNRFEPEFLRCCSYLVSGAQDEVREEERERVAWLAGEYLRYQGSPVDLPAWETWRDETIPGVQSAVVAQEIPPSMPTSSSLQALYLPSPFQSPNIGTFSPRPDGTSNVVSLMDAFGGIPASPSRSAFMDSARAPWATALDREGLSRDVLLMVDHHTLARSLTLFHRSALEQSPENLTASYLLGPDHQSIFFGSDDQPHWLTKLLLIQILGADTSSGYAAGSPGRRVSGEARNHSRFEVISTWIRVGERCRLAGDECSWKAIVAAVCCAPVARLEKVWKRVDPGALAMVESWVQPGPDGEALEVKEPRVTPWGGVVDSLIKDEMEKALVEESVVIRPLERARKMFEGFRTSFSLCPRKVDMFEEECGDDVRRLLTYWRDMFNQGGGNDSLAKFQRVSQFMSLSLAAEPKRKGLFEPYYWTRPSPGNPGFSSLLPLLFPDPLPTMTLIDRSQILRGRLDSDASDIHFLRAVHGHLRPDDGREHCDPIREALGLSRGGTVIPVYNGNLLLVVHTFSELASNSRPSSRVPSRPPSSIADSDKQSVGRSPSIRVKPGSSPSLDRKSSVARRSSLPSLSNPRNFITAEPSSEPPLRVLVQAGTLDVLVDILVHNLHNVSVSVADDNGEMSLREGRTRNLVLDHGEFSKVWWHVFRSFVTPIVFFELLRKMYLKAQTQTASDSLFVIATRTDVLETMKEWIAVGGGAQDILDDVQLAHAIQVFLDTSADHIIYGVVGSTDLSIQTAMRALEAGKQALRRVLESCTMRPPPLVHGPLPRALQTTNESRVRNLSAREPPDVDRVTADELVDNLDGMACAAFSNVTEEDLFITCDLLEVQTADRIGWFSCRDASTSEDTVEIQNIYFHLQEVEPSTLISELTQDSLYRLLPAGIRSCIRAFSILRKWIISKVVAPRLGLRTRQARIELFLRSIEISRLRSTESTSSQRMVDEPCVRSFVEAVVTSAIVSVESRCHHRAWQNIAYNRGSSCDSLVSLLARPSQQLSTSKEALTVDMGWLLERLLDVISTPDVVESASQEAQNLVQFDKRRHLYNLITNTPFLLASRRLVQQNDLNRRAFERLNNIEREVFSIQFDPRGIKEEAQREGAQAVTGGLPSSAKKLPRPFQKLAALQVEKNRRDRNFRVRVQKEKLQEQSKHEKRDDLLNRAMRPRKPVTPAQKQHRNKKSMSAFLNFMRPLSIAFTSDTGVASGLKRTASELDFATSGKPTLVLSLIDARIAQFINNERSFTFLLDTEDGGHYLLQAMSKKEMNKWVETVNRVTKMATKRRLTYIGNPPKPDVSEHFHSHPITPSRDPTAVFGVELNFLLERETGGQEIEPGTIPSIMERCLIEVEARGLSEVGIYRIAGATSEINALKEAFNRGESPIDSTTDIHAVCDLVKSWFRVLPEATFPSSSYHEVIDAMKLENLEDRLAAIRAVVQGLPQANFDLLRRVSEHLDRVTDFEEQNHMTADSLAIVFSPNLLRAPQNDFGLILANMGHTHKLVKALITHFHVIFDDTDPAEEEEDEEGDSPILELDEDEVEADNNNIRLPITDPET
ncbi:rho GTPase activating protein 22 [Mycena floridula]|nr:rho GTPase activating protein 22 [Mycena floridula]